MYPIRPPNASGPENNTKSLHKTSEYLDPNDDAYVQDQPSNETTTWLHAQQNATFYESKDSYLHESQNFNDESKPIPTWISNYAMCCDVVCIVICVLGIIGNILVLTGLWKDKKQSSTSFLLKTLAVTDILFLLPCIPHYANYLIRDAALVSVDSLYARYVYRYIDSITYTLIRSTHLMTVWVAVLVGIHRYIIVCYPFLSKKLCRKIIFKRLLSVVAICSIVFIMEFWIDFKIELGDGPNFLNKTTLEIKPRFQNSSAVNWIVDSFVYQLLVFVIPFLTLSFVTARLLNALHTASRNRTQLQVTPNKNREKSVTRAVIVVLLVFTLCQVSLAVNTFSYICKATMEQCSAVYMNAVITFVLHPTKDCLLVLNSSINFLIYIVMNSYYRKLILGQFYKARN